MKQGNMYFKRQIDFPVTNNHSTILKLIYLWAFAEGGLGGFLHLFHIPVTGLIIGGFAVIINILIAKYSNSNYTVFLKALGIVLATKFLLSPYTPFGAYVAVGFQGLLAAILFPVFRLNKITVLIYALLVMAESALQKPIFAYLIFGKDFWNITAFTIADFLRLSKESVTKVVLLFFSIYFLIYTLWSLVLAYWSNYFIKTIEAYQPDLNEIKKLKFQIQRNELFHKPRKNKIKPYIIGLIITGVTMMFFLMTGKLEVSYLARIIIILILATVVAPALIKRHQGYLIKRNSEIIGKLILAIPEIKINTQVAWKLTAQCKKLNRIRRFLFYTIWLNVFNETHEDNTTLFQTEIPLNTLTKSLH